MIEESLDTGSDNEDVQKSNDDSNFGNICNFLREMKRFCVEKNIEKSEKTHEDSDKFNDAIKKSNKDGTHEEIFNLLQPGSNLSINILHI